MCVSYASPVASLTKDARPKDIMNSMELLAITSFIITVWLGVLMSQSQVGASWMF